MIISMRRQRLFYTLIPVGLLILVTLTACKKRRAFKEENGQVPVDMQMVQAENDAAVTAVNVAVMDQYLLRGKSSGPVEAEDVFGTDKCGLKIDTTKLFSGIAFLNY